MMIFFINLHPKGEPEECIYNALRGASVVFFLYAPDYTAHRYSLKRETGVRQLVGFESMM